MMRLRDVMRIACFKNRSLKMKMTLSVTLLFLAAAVTRTLLATSYIEDASHRLVTEQQNALARSISDDLDQKLLTAQRALITASSQVTPARLADPEKARLFLLDKRPLQGIFADSLLLADAKGKLVAQTRSRPASTGLPELGMRGFFQETVASRLPVIATLPDREPVVVLTAPVCDARGEVIGVLAGSVGLLTPNFLGDLPRMRIGQHGYAFLLTTDGTIIAHPNPRRILQAPTPAAKRLFERSVSGHADSSETISATGTPVLTSFRRLHATNWVLGLNSPVEETFAVTRELRSKLAWWVVIGTGFVLAAVWLIMQWLTRPLRSLTRQVELMGEGTELRPLESLESSYEIATLKTAFNHLIDTVRKQQQSMQENEKKYRIVSDNAYDWQYWLSPEGCFIYSSPSGKRITGYDAVDFLSDPGLLERIIHPDDQELFLTCRRRVLKEKSMQETEWRVVRSDGEIRWISHLCQPIYNDAGIYLGIRGNNRDITEQRKIEVELQQSEERYRTLVECSPDGILLHRDGVYIYANPAACRLLGASDPAQILGRSVMSFVHPEYREKVAARIKNAETGGKPNPCTEQKVLRLDGSSVEVEAVGAALTFQGRPAVKVILRDISARKEAERALRQGEETLRDLMDIMPVGVVLVGTDGAFEYVNRSFEETFGFPSGVIPDNEEWELRALPDPDYRSKVMAQRDKALAEAMANGIPSAPLEVDLTCHDGSVRHMIINMRLSGSRRISIFTDITERELLQNELLKAQKLESLGVLAGGIAHDFNNILTGILGNISFARMFLEEAHKSYLPLSHAEKASLRAAELATQLLTFARGGAPVKKIVSLPRLVEEAVSLVLRGTNVTAALKIEEKLPRVEADEGQINQAFHNIILNAVQAMPGGGTLTVGAESLAVPADSHDGLPAGHYVVLRFADEGCGMPSEIQQKIFDPYFTTKPKGTGLGLASVHSIISKHGGKVKVASAPGKGTSFTLLLPAVEGADGEQAAAMEAEAMTPAARAGEPLLVMDDEPIILEFAREMLKHQGYRVTTCMSGERAIELHREAREAGEPFAVAIMDLTVPGGMGGKEAALRILAEDPTARLIVSSGYSSDPVLAEYRNFGFCAAVAKPYKGRELARALAAAMAVEGEGTPASAPEGDAAVGPDHAQETDRPAVP